MKFNQWTLGLAAAGVINLASAAKAEEAPSQVLTALSSTTLSGYVDTSANWKIGTGRQIVGRFNDGTSKQDQFNLNVVKLSLEKPLSEGEWSAGYKFDMLFGPDAGLYNPSSINTSYSPTGYIPSLGDTAIKQAYVALRAPVGNGLDIKMGVFDTIIGYEVFESPNNPNFSRSYGWTLEPTQHTGLLASYHVTDWLSVAGGIANTYNAGIGFQAVRASAAAAGGVLPASTSAAESEKTYMGSFTLTAPESWGVFKGAAFYAGAVNGLNNALSPTAGDTTSLYAGTTVPTPFEGLAFGAAYDYRASEVLDAAGQKTSNYANAVSVYASFTLNNWKFNNRIEYASGSYGTFGASTGGDGGTKPKDPGTPEQLFSETFTVDYSLWVNVLSRVEFRWDHDLKGKNGGAYPFGIDDRNALTLALNIVYKF